MRRSPILLGLIALPLASACRPAGDDALRVFAAASLRDVCVDLEHAWTRTGGGPVRFNFGASSDLARQLVAGARADLFLSADELQADRVAEELPVVARTTWLSNQLVLVAPLDADVELATPADLGDAGVRRVALALSEVVPAGRYAREWLAEIGLWEVVAPKVVPFSDVRATLAAVESGAAEAGVVYATDAARAQRVRVVHAVPRGEGPVVSYAAVRVGGSAESARLFAWITGEEALAVALRHGFLPPGPDAPGDREARGAGGAGRAVTPSAPPASAAWTPLFISLRVAGCAALLALFPGVALGYLLARTRFRGKSLVETLVALPLVLPPTAIGYGVLKLVERRGPLGRDVLGFDPDLLLSWKGAVLAATVMSLPLVARTARVAFEGVPSRLEQMGRSLGWSLGQVLARVTLPLARRGLLAAAVLGFARALGEFGATVIVAGNVPGETSTLALAIFQEIQLDHGDRVLFLVGVSTLLAFATVWTVERLLARGATPGVHP